MRKDTIKKKQDTFLIEEIPNSPAIFRKFEQAKVILHGKSAGFPVHKFQSGPIERGVLVESVKANVFKHLKEVVCQMSEKNSIIITGAINIKYVDNNTNALNSS
ncbi:hypothetical protein P5V15_013398 [Pogonomyrmex californicus]